MCESIVLSSATYYSPISIQAKKPVREDITESKEDISAFKQEMNQMMVCMWKYCVIIFTCILLSISMQEKKPAREDTTGLREDISTFKQEMMVCNTCK